MTNVQPHDNPPQPPTRGGRSEELRQWILVLPVVIPTIFLIIGAIGGWMARAGTVIERAFATTWVETVDVDKSDVTEVVGGDRSQLPGGPTRPQMLTFIQTSSENPASVSVSMLSGFVDVSRLYWWTCNTVHGRGIVVEITLVRELNQDELNKIDRIIQLTIIQPGMRTPLQARPYNDMT